MKIMNEIEAEKSGTILKLLIDDGMVDCRAIRLESLPCLKKF